MKNIYFLLIVILFFIFSCVPQQIEKVLTQVEMVRKVGINNVFVFYSLWISPPPPIEKYPTFFTNPGTSQEGVWWKNSYAERIELENYIASLRNKK